MRSGSALLLASLLLVPAAAAAPSGPPAEGPVFCFGLAPAQTSCGLAPQYSGSPYVRTSCFGIPFTSCFFGTVRLSLVSLEEGSFALTCDVLPGATVGPLAPACRTEGSLQDIVPPFYLTCETFMYGTGVPGGAGLFECGLAF